MGVSDSARRTILTNPAKPAQNGINVSLHSTQLRKAGCWGKRELENLFLCFKHAHNLGARRLDRGKLSGLRLFCLGVFVSFSFTTVRCSLSEISYEMTLRFKFHYGP